MEVETDSSIEGTSRARRVRGHAPRENFKIWVFEMAFPDNLKQDFKDAFYNKSL